MQPKLFEVPNETVAIEDVLLYALGDFQSRGKVLADRELAFDRIRGAFLRALAKFGVAEILDERVVNELRQMGATVTEVPSFVAKRPYRIIITSNLAESARDAFLLKENKQL